MLNIERKLINCNYEKRTNRDIKYIVVHYTTDRNGNALNSVNWFGNPNAQSSAHYVVDKDHIYQIVEDKNKAWHCGSKNGYKHPDCRNENSIGIEVASVHPDKKSKTIPAEDPDWRFDDKAVDNTIDLTVELMKKYNIPIENVLMHYDVTGKICPAPFVNYPSKWSEFIGRVNAKYKYQKDPNINVNTPSNWAKSAWDKAVELKIFDGTNPHGTVTREMLAVVLERCGLLDK